MNAPELVRLRLSATLTVMLTGLAVPAAAELVSVNPEFGLYVPVPEGLKLCEMPEVDDDADTHHDHGPVVFLDPADSQTCDANEPEHRRAIYVSAWYNATDETRTLKSFRRDECKNERCLPAPTGLSFPNSRSTSFRVNRPDGWIDIVVLTQAGHDDFAFPGDPEFRVNYIATLHTDPAHLAADLRLFRAHLRKIRFTRLEPNKDSFSPEEFHRIRHEQGLE
jgi:hypothetical protein